MEYDDMKEQLLKDPEFLRGMSDAILPAVPVRSSTQRDTDVYENFWKLTAHTMNCLLRARISPEQALVMTEEQLASIKLLGPTRIKEIVQKRMPLPY